MDVSDAALQRGVSMGEMLERGPAAAEPRQPSAIDVRAPAPSLSPSLPVWVFLTHTAQTTSATMLVRHDPARSSMNAS